MTEARKMRPNIGSGFYVTKIASDSVADNAYEFEVGTLEHPIDMFLDEFRFVNASGESVIPTAGQVAVQVSSDGKFWRNLNNGSFSATIDTTSAEYQPPSGLAAITKMRVVLSGVTGASGFRGNFIRG